MLKQLIQWIGSYKVEPLLDNFNLQGTLLHKALYPGFFYPSKTFVCFVAIRTYAIMHRIYSLEIKVHYLDVIAFLRCYLVDPGLTSARNQIQMAVARLNS